MNLDETQFGFGDVVKVTGLETATVSNWTNRGLVDPHVALGQRRGRGFARAYTARNILKFALMADLSRIFIPLPAAKLICRRVFADFKAANPGCWLIKKVMADPDAGTSTLHASFHLKGAEALHEAARLGLRAPLIIDAAAVYRDCMHALEALLAERETTP
jgi:hypothetical protein